MNTITTQLRPPYGHGQFETVLPPSDWIVARLGDCGEVIMGQSPPGVSYNRSGGSPLINGPTEFTELHPVKVQWTTQPARFCRPGDLLICVRGSSTGRTNYADEIYAIGRGVAAIRAKADNDTQYLSYQVISGVSDILAAATGSTFPSVDGASFRKIRVLLPPPAEQRAIAEALSDVDGLLGALEELIAKKRAIKQAAMQQLLTGKTRLPGFSGAWEMKKISEVATYCNEKNSLAEDLPVLTCSKHLGFVDSLSYFKNQIFSKDLSGYKIIRRGQIGYPANHIEEGSIGLQDIYDIALVSPIYVVCSPNPKNS